MPTMDHPWRRFRAMSAWRLDLAWLPDELAGVTNHRAKTVTIDKRLLQAERRCTIAHELEHIRRGPLPNDPVLAAREEAAIDQAVAHRLITLDALATALAWSRDPHEVAEELWVDVPTLLTRIKHLHPAERAFLARRLEHVTP